MITIEEIKKLIDQHLAADLMMVGLDKIRYRTIRDELAQAIYDKQIKKLQHEYDTTRGLFCIDRDPKKEGLEWIRKNAFQLTNKKEK